MQPLLMKYETICLLPVEQLLRELLLDCRADLRKRGNAAASTLDIWVTGGWVRDRLLGIASSDVDIALSSLTGEQFGNALTSYISQHKDKYQQRAAVLGVQDTEFTGFHTTRQNPGKSKKLETAVGKVFGLDLDLVNLRKEVYEDDSRTPEMEFGTAEEDAFRRDATVNALFFNLDTQQVVDHTGRGLQDMKEGIMRTPLDPWKTFMDDPLRVLRLIRLGSKLGYKIDPKAMACMQDDKVHAALDAKVSRERVGIELFKTMKNSNPQIAFHLIFEAKLYPTVFLGLESPLCQPLKNKLPPDDPDQPWPRGWPGAYEVLAELQHGTNALAKIVQSQEKADLLWFMAACAPLAGLRNTQLKETVKDVTEAVKATTEVTKLLEQALRKTDSIRSTVSMVVAGRNASPPRGPVGMAIRSWGSTWTLQLIHSLLAEIVYTTPPTTQRSSALSKECDDPFAPILQRYSAFLEFVIQHNLQDAHRLKPALDGNEIKKLFGLVKGGNFLKTAIDGLVAWQLDHPGYDSEAARMWLLEQRENLGILSA